jgi:nitrous oxide reductase accessory protein NosL
MMMFKFRFFTVLFFCFLTVSIYAYPDVSDAVKEKKIYPMGEKIYKKKCHKIDVNKFLTYEDLEKHTAKKGVCTKLNKRYKTALDLYLWDVVKSAKVKKIYPKLTVTKDEKCPVCGMFLYLYPTWVSKIIYPKNEVYAFDGVKDMMRFYFNNVEGISHIYVQDYYTQKTLEARDSYFVLGSDVYGPMGVELIPFETKAKAEKFSLDHRGKKVVKFQNILPGDVYEK